MKVAAIVLAAGESRRMGRPKMTLPWGDSTILETVIGVLEASGIASITVVAGRRAGEITGLLTGRNVSVAVNPRPEDGMLSSAQHGLAAAPADADAYLFSPGDQPQIEPRVVRALLAAAEHSPRGIFVPVHGGRRGHPALFRARLRGDILGLPLSVGLNHLARTRPEEVEEVPVDAPAVLEDVDTPEDYRRAVPPALDRAVIPAAGLGTRLRPLTLAIPKEMLPLGRKPVLEYVVEELRAAGIVRLVFVVSPGKEMIRRYFEDGARWGVRCDYVVQPEMRGLGDAVLRGEEWTEGRPFVAAFGDCIIHSPSPLSPLARLVAAHARERSAATVLTERVPRERTGRYGILAPAVAVPESPTEPFPLADIVEKPSPERAPSTLAVAARWALGPAIFEHIRRAAPGPDGEVNLTDPVRALLAGGGAGWAVPLRPGEARLDIGGWETYLTAAARAAAEDAEAGPRVRAALREALEVRE